MGMTCPTSTLGKSSYCLRSSAGFQLPLHRGMVAGRPAAFSQVGATVRGLVATTAGGAVVRWGVTKAWWASGTAARAPPTTFIPANAGAGRTTAVIVFGAASGAAALFLEHPHIEGGIAVELKV